MRLTISSLCSVKLIYQYLQLRKEVDGADPWLEDIDTFLNSSTRFTIALASQKENLLCMEVGGTSQVKVKNLVAQDSCFYFCYSQTTSRSIKASWNEDYIDLLHVDPQNLPIPYKCLRGWWRAELLLKRQIDICILSSVIKGKPKKQ